jgi:hypothetical protein
VTVERSDGAVVGRLAMDAVALAGERCPGGELLTAVVVLTVEDEDGEIRSVIAAHPGRD